MEPADDWNVPSGGNDVLVDQRHEPVDSDMLVLIHVYGCVYENWSVSVSQTVQVRSCATRVSTRKTCCGLATSACRRQATTASVRRQVSVLRSATRYVRPRSVSAPLVFAIFSPHESALGADDWSVPYFSICQGTLPWQPNNVGWNQKVMKADRYHVHFFALAFEN